MLVTSTVFNSYFFSRLRFHTRSWVWFENTGVTNTQIFFFFWTQYKPLWDQGYPIHFTISKKTSCSVWQNTFSLKALSSLSLFHPASVFLMSGREVSCQNISILSLTAARLRWMILNEVSGTLSVVVHYLPRFPAALVDY